MAFVKSVAKWASIWTLVIIGFFVVQEVQAGRPLNLATFVLLSIVIWIVVAGLVTFSKILKGARSFGASIGRAAVKTPKQDAGAAVDDAINAALRASGVKNTTTK